MFLYPVFFICSPPISLASFLYSDVFVSNCFFNLFSRLFSLSHSNLHALSTLLSHIYSCPLFPPLCHFVSLYIRGYPLFSLPSFLVHLSLVILFPSFSLSLSFSTSASLFSLPPIVYPSIPIPLGHHLHIYLFLTCVFILTKTSNSSGSFSPLLSAIPHRPPFSNPLPSSSTSSYCCSPPLPPFLLLPLLLLYRRRVS